jgi:aminomethyltransferase
MIALQGQASQAVLQGMTRDLDLASIGYYKFSFGTVAAIKNMRVSRTGYTGEDGFELYVPKSEVVRVWNECMAHGSKHGLKPIGLGARDTLRLEAGMPLYGHEIDATHNPIEAGLEFGVSFKPEKGDWIGRAALEKVAQKKSRHLVGIKTDGPRVPRQGYELVAGGEKIGYVVSGSVSPTVKSNIGTCYVPVAHGKPGDPVEIDIKGKRQAATYCTLPFFSRTRK